MLRAWGFLEKDWERSPLVSHTERKVAHASSNGQKMHPPLVSGTRVTTPAGVVGVVSLVSYCELLHRWRCSVFTDDALPSGFHYAIYDAYEVEALASSPERRI